MMMNEDEIVVLDDEGKEYTFKILFTYENDERGTKYIFFYDPNDEDEVLFARYYDDGHLEYIEDEEEIAEVEEVFAAYNENGDFVEEEE